MKTIHRGGRVYSRRDLLLDRGGGGGVVESQENARKTSWVCWASRLGKRQHGAGHGSWHTCEQNGTTLREPHNDPECMTCILSARKQHLGARLGHPKNHEGTARTSQLIGSRTAAQSVRLVAAAFSLNARS